MNIFDQYGIKEVADVTIYSIHKKKDGSGDLYYVPALFLDTLKISSVDKTAENVWAEGGLGNARLISWDYGKQLNISLEDALCTPASLGMCWGGILGADWQDGHIEQQMGISFNRNNEVEKISRFEKAFFPHGNKKKSYISYLLPRTDDDNMDKKLGVLLNSSIIDGTDIMGFGMVNNHSYKWKMFLESNIQSIAVVPDRFFDVNNNPYLIDVTHQLIVNDNLGINKFNIIYKINDKDSSLVPPEGSLIIDKSIKTEKSNNDSKTQTENESYLVSYDQNKATFTPPASNEEKLELKEAQYLCIVITQEDNYIAYISKDGEQWFLPNIKVNTSQFKNIDLWLRFSSINEMVYYILTKYEDNIMSIGPATIKTEIGGDVIVEKEENKTNKLWAYVNPKTMTPYSDDYWFHQGEPYYIKTLTLKDKEKKLKSQRITITAGQFPGMYMIVGETYIRSRDTGEDERIQLKFPLCKILSNQSITLEAGGDPTTFNLEVQVAKPINGTLMEITSYETSQTKIMDEDGRVEIKDGSTEVLSE